MRWLKRAVIGAAQKFGYEISRNPDGVVRVDPRLELGKNELEDMKTILAREPRCIFDVGAHIGQTAAKFAAVFPAAEIYSFEPDSRTFETLRANTAALPRVHPQRFAVGAAPGEATLFCNVFDQTNSLLPNAANAGEFTLSPDYMKPERTETVPVTTVDEFCAKNGIRTVDILKIDTQGLELEVLRGAAQTLSQTVVPLIYAEVSFIRAYENQPLFHEVYEYLYAREYRLVGLYESGYLTHYYQVGGNGLFVHASVGKRPARTRRFRVGHYELYR